MENFPDNINLKINKTEQQCEAIIATFPCRPVVNKDDTIDSVKLYRKLNLNKKNLNEHLLLSESDGMQYTGYDFGDQAPVANIFTKYMVGIFNKKKNKLQILDTSYFIMNPHIKKSDNNLNLVKSDDVKSNMNQIKDLVKAFGTSKSRRAYDARDKNQIDDGTLENIIGSAVQDTSVAKTPTLDKSVGQYMPVCNENATAVNDIYPIENIISANEMDSLRNYTLEFDTCTRQIIDEWQDKKKYPIFILNHLRKLPSSDDLRSKRIRELLFLHYMILLVKMSNYHLRNKGEVMKLEIPKMIKSNLLNKFTRKVAGNDTQITMPTHLRDSLLLNILIVCLTIDSFVSDVQILNMTVANGKDIAKYLRQLGCKVGEKATLTVPFVKPTYIKLPSKRTRSSI